MKRLTKVTFLLLMLAALPAQAVSFSADAVQIRDGQLSLAKLTWDDDRVRFDYVQDGVAMAQIFDTDKKKMTWLDTEKKEFFQRDIDSTELPGSSILPQRSMHSPCDIYESAECTRLKRVTLNEREAVKWLITFSQGQYDQHLFMWIDSKLGIVLRQESPDGSMFDVIVQEDVDFNGRKARKQEMYAVSADGLSMQGAQWIDEELNIVLRQQNDTGAVDELRNITTHSIDRDLFKVPVAYKQITDPLFGDVPEVNNVAADTAAMNNQ